jgi:hypothetical protein
MQYAKIHGVRWSVLLRLIYFDAVRFVVVDPMHTVYSCVVTHAIQTFIDSGMLDKGLFSERLASIKLPCSAGRTYTQCVDARYLGYMRAVDWKHLVEITGAAVLEDLLPPDAFQVWQKLCAACKLLCDDVVKISNVDRCQRQLLAYCSSFQKLFGEDAVKPTMHFVIHLPEMSLDYGSANGYWCFGFERMNGLLGLVPNNRRFVESTLLRTFMEHSHLRTLPWNTDSLISKSMEEKEFKVLSLIYGGTYSTRGAEADVLRAATLVDTSTMVIVEYWERLQNKGMSCGLDRVRLEWLGQVTRGAVIDTRLSRTLSEYAERTYLNNRDFPDVVSVQVAGQLSVEGAALSVFNDQLTTCKARGGRSGLVLCIFPGGIVAPCSIQRIIQVAICVREKASTETIVVLRSRLVEAKSSQIPVDVLLVEQQLAELHAQATTGSVRELTLIFIKQFKPVQRGCYLLNEFKSDRAIVVPIQNVCGKFAPYVFTHDYEVNFQGERSGSVTKKTFRPCPIKLKLL